MDTSTKQKKISTARAQVLDNPMDPSLWRELANAMRALDQHDLTQPSDSLAPGIAEKGFLVNCEKVSENDANEVKSLIEGCLDNQRKHDFKCLEVSVEQLNTIAPDNPWTLAILGILYTHKRKYKEAKTSLDQAIQIEPTNSWFKLWICENAIHSRDTETLIAYGKPLSFSEPNKRMALVSLIATTLEIIVDSPEIAAENLLIIYKELLLDLAKSDEVSIQHMYHLVIRGIEARLHSIATSPGSTNEIIMKLHELTSSAAKLMKS
jgi:hypothetical protein